MSENQFKLDHDGQAVTQDDLNDFGEVVAQIDDHVLAEFLKIPPYDGSTVSKCITPSGDVPLMAPGGADAKVVIGPFRAFVGSRTAEGTDALANHRDIVSGLSVAASDTSRTKEVTLAANASGDNRWDLICAVVSLGSDLSPVTRLVKDPTSAAVSSVSVSVFEKTAVTLQVVQGTAAASPTFPDTPADTATTFYVPIGYVLVPDGFNATSQVLDWFIAEVGEVRNFTGARPARRTWTAAKQQSWGAATDTNTRPSGYLPTSLGRVGDDVLILLDLLAAANNDASWSHVDGDVVDSSDWRGCFVKFVLQKDDESFETRFSSGIPAEEGSAFPPEVMFGFAKSSSSGDNEPLVELGGGMTLVVRASDGALIFQSGGAAPACTYFIWATRMGRYTHNSIVDTISLGM